MNSMDVNFSTKDILYNLQVARRELASDIGEIEELEALFEQMLMKIEARPEKTFLKLEAQRFCLQVGSAKFLGRQGSHLSKKMATILSDQPIFPMEIADSILKLMVANDNRWKFSSS